MFSVYIFPVYIAWQAYVSNGKREKCHESITAQQGSVSKPKPVRIWPREDARWESWQMRLQNYKDLSYTKIIPRLAEQSCCHRVTSFKVFSIMTSKSLSLPRFHHNKQPEDLRASCLPCEDCSRYRFYGGKSKGVQPLLVSEAAEDWCVLTSAWWVWCKCREKLKVTNLKLFRFFQTP